MAKVLERGEKLEVLEDKSTALSSSSLAFQKSGRNLRRFVFMP
jgi:hypothetical protein